MSGLGLEAERAGRKLDIQDILGARAVEIVRLSFRF
jgi:hypothetical protein